MADLIKLPPISVVVSTYNRGEQFLQTLNSLAKQKLPFNEYEVIVIDNHNVPNIYVRGVINDFDPPHSHYIQII